MSLQNQSLNYSLLSVDYNNVQNREQLQKIIIESKAIIQNKIKNINTLTEIRDKEESEREIIINRMKQNTQKNGRQIQMYKQQIQSINQSYQRFLKQSQQEKEKQRKGIQTMHQLEVTQTTKKIEELEAEYKKLKQFQQQESLYQFKIQELKRQLVTRQYEHHDSMNKQQSLQLKQNKQLQSKYKHQVNDTRKNAPTQAITKISTEVYTNEQQNHRLKQRLLLLQTELGKLKKQRNQIVGKRKQIKINVNLNEQQLEEYKAVGSLQKAKIKAYKDKIQNLKILISQQVSKKQKQLSDRKKQRQSHLKTLKLKQFNLQKQKQQLKLKMQRMNILGQTILQQRSQIQQFFIMALQSCKKQIEGQYNNKPHKHDDKVHKSYGDKVDIDELLPQDKQRILTNLYTKLAFGTR